MGALPVCAGRTLMGVYRSFKYILNSTSVAEANSLNLERPPQLEPQTRIEDTIIQDWRWLSLRCERRLMNQSRRRVPVHHVADALGAKFDISQFACFVPRTVLEAIADCRIRYTDDFDIIIEQFDAAVVFCDASGFTALTEALDKEPNGAEKLGDCINAFFGPLIQIVSYWGGDIIKFSGDAITIVWPVDDVASTEDFENDAAGDIAGAFQDGAIPDVDRDKLRASRNVDSAGGQQSFGRTFSRQSSRRTSQATYHIDRRQACRLACQCCLDLHYNLNLFPTPVEGKFFTVHISVGYGRVTILQVGGTLDRWEYVVGGPPLQQISLAEPLANSGETVLSSAVVEVLGGEEGVDCTPVWASGSEVDAPEYDPATEGYVKLIGLKGPDVVPPPPLENIVLDDTDVNLLKRFIPPAVFKRLTAGHNVFINELRRVSVVFVGVRGLNVATERGSQIAHKLMQLTQKAAYTMEGSVNKFLVDDKGVLVLIMFGLPPVYHLDDALRAVMAALRIVDGLRMLGLTAGIGVATGRVWCGTVGCWLRKEYTAMGDTVNLAARLMGKAQINEINCDLETKSLCDYVMEFRSFPPVRLKGKQCLVPFFQPTGRMNRQAVLQTMTGEPIGTWPGWKYKRRLYNMLFPGYEYRPPIIGYDVPPLDFPLRCGPRFPWEYVDPWMPSLCHTIDLGGVAVIVGKETEGTTELVQYVAELGRKLGRSVFLCSNMPDSTYVNIGNVPLLAWRKLCTEMVETWRWSPARDRKGYSKVDRDNSIYGLAKELIHPMLHWRLHEMKSVIHGLVLPYEVPQNQAVDVDRLRKLKMLRKGTRHRFERMFGKTSQLVAEMKRGDRRLAEGQSDDDDGSDAEKNQEKENTYPPLNAMYMPNDYGLGEETERSLAPVIGSLVNGFSMYEPSILCLHVRAGTSQFASMDSESWKVAARVGSVAIVRRRRKIDLDMKEVKKWRRRHSRDCVWCRGTAKPYNRLNGELCQPKWTSCCKPLPSKYFPPFIFILVCSETTSHVREQQELIEWARESNCLIKMKRLTPLETGSYLGHCLSVTRRAIPDELIEYVYRISAGIPKYIYLTARQLVTEQAIVISDVEHGSAAVAALGSSGRKQASESSVLSSALSQSPIRLPTSDSKKAVNTTPVGEKNVLSGTTSGGTSCPLSASEGADSLLTSAEEPEDVLKKTDFTLLAPGLTGRSGIPEDADTSDEDSEAPDDSNFFHNQCKRLSVYTFKQDLQLNPELLRPDGVNVNSQRKRTGRTSLPRLSVLGRFKQAPSENRVSLHGYQKIPSPSSSCRVSSVAEQSTFANGAQEQNDYIEDTELEEDNATVSAAAALVVNQVEVSGQYVVDPDVHICHVGEHYVRNASADPPEFVPLEQSGKPKQSDGFWSRAVAPSVTKTAPARKNAVSHTPRSQTDRSQTTMDAFVQTYTEAIADSTRYGEAKYEGTAVVEDLGTQLKEERNAEGEENVEMQPPTSVSTRLPSASQSFGNTYVPPGPDLFANHISQYAFAPIATPVCATSYAKELEQRSATHQSSALHHSAVSGAALPINTGGSKNDRTETFKIPFFREVRIIKDLKRVPFVSDLRAAAMSLMERLEPDEQLAAKVASVFPVSFTGFEVQAVYPRQMSSESFQKMIENLIGKEMLESCEPPTEEQLEELRLLPLPRQHKASSSEVSAVSAAAKSVGGRKLTSDEEPKIVERSESQNSDVSSDESLVSESKPVASRWGLDEDGNPLFYRFTSIAFQHVVSDLLMSQEREFLARISRKVICFRRTYGLNFLIKQISATPQEPSFFARLPQHGEMSHDFVSSWDPSFGTKADDKSALPPTRREKSQCRA